MRGFCGWWSAGERAPPKRQLLSCGAGGSLFAAAPPDVVAGVALWRPDLVPTTVILDAAPGDFASGCRIDPTSLGPLLADQLKGEARHLIIADAAGEHRLWLRDTALDGGIAAIIPLDRDFDTRMASLTRFHRALFGRAPGPPPRGWRLTDYQRRRLEQMLRALDLHQSGSNYREIAIVLGDEEAAGMSSAEWKGSRGRAYVIRLVASATRMMNGGYRTLLRIGRT